MTSESESQTEPWVKDKGANYAYAYDRGGKLANALGVRGIPNAVLVDPSGTIIWQGHPGSLSSSQIEKALEGAISLPVYEWGKSAKSIKKAFLNQEFAKAIEAADKLGQKEESGKQIAGLLRGMVTSRVAALQADLEKGDVFKALSGAEALSKNLKGLPERDTLEELITKVSKDPVLSEVSEVQGKLNDIMSDERKKWKDCDASVKKLKKLLEGHEGSYTGTLIEKAIEAVAEERRALKR